MGAVSLDQLCISDFIDALILSVNVICVLCPDSVLFSGRRGSGVSNSRFQSTLCECRERGS